MKTISRFWSSIFRLVLGFTDTLETMNHQMIALSSRWRFSPYSNQTPERLLLKALLCSVSSKFDNWYDFYRCSRHRAIVITVSDPPPAQLHTWIDRYNLSGETSLIRQEIFGYITWSVFERSVCFNVICSHSSRKQSLFEWFGSPTKTRAVMTNSTYLSWPLFWSADRTHWKKLSFIQL